MNTKEIVKSNIDNYNKLNEIAENLKARIQELHEDILEVNSAVSIYTKEPLNSMFKDTIIKKEKKLDELYSELSDIMLAIYYFNDCAN